MRLIFICCSLWGLILTAQDCRTTLAAREEESHLELPLGGASWGTLSLFREGKSEIDIKDFRFRARASFGTKMDVGLLRTNPQRATELLAKFLIHQLVAFPVPRSETVTNGRRWVRSVAGKVIGVDVSYSEAKGVQVSLTVREYNYESPETYENVDLSELYLLLDIVKLNITEPSAQDSEVLGANGGYGSRNGKMGEMAWEVCAERGWCFRGFGIPLFARVFPGWGEKHLLGKLRLTTTQRISIGVIAQSEETEGDTTFFRSNSPAKDDVTISTARIERVKAVWIPQIGYGIPQIGYWRRVRDFYRGLTAVPRVIKFSDLVRRLRFAWYRTVRGEWGWSYSTIELKGDGNLQFNPPSFLNSAGTVEPSDPRRRN